MSRSDKGCEHRYSGLCIISLYTSLRTGGRIGSRNNQKRYALTPPPRQPHFQISMSFRTAPLALRAAKQAISRAADLSLESGI